MRKRRLLWLMLACSILAAAPGYAETTQADSPTNSTRVAAVVLDGDTLFLVRGISSLPAEMRAREIRQRIIELAEDPSIDPQDNALKNQGNLIAVIIAGREVVTLAPVDAELENVPVTVLADEARNRIVAGIVEYREARSPQNLLRNTGILAAASIAAALLLWAVLRLFAWLNTVVERRVKIQIQQLEQVSHRVLDARQIWGWVGGLLRGIRTLTVIALVMLWLNTALGMYPWTRPLAAELFVLVLGPVQQIASGALATLPDLVFLAVLFLVVRFFLRVIRTFFDRVNRGWIRLETFDRELALPTYRIVRVLIVVFALVIAYPYIPGSDSEAFKGLSIFFGLVLSIGSSSFIANIIAGYSLTYRRAFREGDRIKVGELEGLVLEMRTLNTRIKSLKNEEINIPNSVVVGSAIVNYTTFQREPGLIMHTEVGIGYDVPWRQVEAMLLEAARRTEGLLREPPPFVLQQSLGDFTAVYQLNAYCNDAESMNSRYSILHGNIQDIFNEYGVQIMSPNYVSDPSEAKLVPPDQWYAAPAQPPSV